MSVSGEGTRKASEMSGKQTALKKKEGYDEEKVMEKIRMLVAGR